MRKKLSTIDNIRILEKMHFVTTRGSIDMNFEFDLLNDKKKLN